jgi:hypothetical protein
MRSAASGGAERVSYSLLRAPNGDVGLLGIQEERLLCA